MVYHDLINTQEEQTYALAMAIILGFGLFVLNSSTKNKLENMLVWASAVIVIEGHIWHLNFGQGGYETQIPQNLLGLTVIVWAYQRKFNKNIFDMWKDSKHAWFYWIAVLTAFSSLYFFWVLEPHGPLGYFDFSPPGIHALWGIYAYGAMAFLYFNTKK